jgi:hypothetical protein
VPAAAHRQRHIAFSREGECRDHVVSVCTVSDRGWPFVDETVPNAPCLLEAGIGWQYQVSAKGAAEPGCISQAAARRCGVRYDMGLHFLLPSNDPRTASHEGNAFGKIEEIR